MDWMHNEGCARQFAALCLGLAAAVVGLGVALGYGLRWLLERGR